LADDRASRYNCALANDGTAQQSRAHANQDIIANLGAMNDGTVADGAPCTNMQWYARVTMNDAPILDIRLRANAYRRIIPPNDGIKPNGNFIT